ncbi:hypothetical protein [Sunxiuqinia sp. sy24]|uniref:hypothetical protein n=1 Tax=Sunxiuqinia sp. sy24 TaxID=3461495 RepID=UPI00404647A4
MKQWLIFCLLVLQCFTSSAQDSFESSLQQAYSLSKKATLAAEKTEEHLRFVRGAFDANEINRHLLAAREDLDSLITFSRQAAYKSSDAAYFAQTKNAASLQQAANETKKRLQKSTRTLENVLQKIDEFIIHGTYNRDTYLTQLMQNFDLGQSQVHTASQNLKKALPQLSNSELVPDSTLQKQ